MTLQAHPLPSLVGVKPYFVRRTETLYLPVWQDRDGNPYVNSAGAPLIKPVYEPHAVLCIHGEMYRDLLEFTDIKIASLIDRVNAAPWRGFPAGQAWISEINTKRVTINGYEIDRVDIIVRCLASRSWQTIIPDMGYYYMEGGARKAFQTSDGFQFLGNLDAGAAEDGAQNMLTFNYKGEANFAELRF